MGLALSLALLAGCAGAGGAAAGARPGDGWTRAEGVPLVRQTTEDGCGAAALAMVLAAHGVPADQEALRAEVPSAPGEGIQAGLLRDLARARGLRAFVVEGTPDDLRRELGNGRPVVVGLVKKQGRRLVPHYEVVVGVDRDGRRIAVLDPARGRRERKAKELLAEWQAAGRVTLVVLPAKADAR